MRPVSELRARIGRTQRLLLIAAVIGIVVCTYGFVELPTEFFPAYLIGFLLCLGITLGSWALILIHNLTGGDWGVAIRPVARSAATTIPLLGLLFIPILFGIPVLYEWADPSHAEHDAVLRSKMDYLNVPFFQIRAAIYFVLWIPLVLASIAWTGRRDRREALQGVPDESRGLQLFSGPSLLTYGLTITFAAVDWAMSIEPHWFSATYGVLFMGAHALSGLSFSILLTVALAEFHPFSRLVSRERFHDLGNLLLAMVMFWSYIAFMQYLIIWSGNLPEETPYYARRNAGGWQAIAPILMVLHFAVPFALLLIRSTKRRASRLAMVAALLLLMRLVDLYWLVLPPFARELSAVHWIQLVVPLGILAVWLAAFMWRLSAAATWEERLAMEGAQ